MTLVKVRCRLAPIDMEACHEYARKRDMDVQDIKIRQEDIGVLEWIFSTTATTLDVLR